MSTEKNKERYPRQSTSGDSVELWAGLKCLWHIDRTDGHGHMDSEEMLPSTCA